MRLFLLLLFSCSPSVALSPSAQHSSAVKVEANCTGGGLIGSGVLIDPWHVLTAGHVLKCKGTLLNVTVNNLPALLDFADWRHDVARLRLKDEQNFPTLHISPPVEDSLLCSEPMWPEIARHCGLLRAVLERNFAGLFVDLDLALPVEHGNSGAGLFDQNGYLVGLVTHAQEPKGASGGFGTSLARLRLQ